ncbi:mechanosensitive ion channel [bacterium]|nr:mechanosensitive ion channel [bacterium]
MEFQLNIEMVQQWLGIFQQWVYIHILSWVIVAQIVILIASRLLGEIIGRPARKSIGGYITNRSFPYVLIKSLLTHLVRLIPLLLSIIFLWATLLIFQRFEISIFIMKLALNLSMAWVIVQLATSTIPDRYWSRLIGVLVWSLAALNIIGLSDPFIALLRSTGFSIGQTRLTLLSVLQAVIILLVLLKGVGWLSRYIEVRLNGVPGLNSSTRLMLSKVMYITMVIMVTIIVLNSVGIDLTSLAFFSGAIGVGVGFGLQKVVSNFISGLILLSDRSIKPGDVIQLDEAVGRVRIMGGRYVSVVTRDEKEYLIPNEDLITQQVINWSYSNRIIRLKVPFGVSYRSDPHQVIKLVVSSVTDIARILKDPVPVCLLTGFGDSSIDFELRFWIKDPQNGVSNVIGDVLLAIWDTLKQNNIEIPFPQRDLHFKTPFPTPEEEP